MLANLAYYAFFKLEDLPLAKSQLHEIFAKTNVRGTIIIAQEGLNCNLAGEQAELKNGFKAFLELWNLDKSEEKWSTSLVNPFDRFQVKVKKEICTLGLPEIDVQKWRAPYIEASDLKAKIKNGLSDTLLMDNRKKFEYDMGSFQGAVPVDNPVFSRFPEYADKIEEEHGKEKEIIMFCTGGIRCEKAGAYMRSRGFKNVKQLKGGILRYFEEEGANSYEGNCFVFDGRGLVDPELKAAGQGIGLLPYNLVPIHLKDYSS